MLLDNDLQSIQEMSKLVQKAKQAQLEFRAYDQVRVDRIVKAGNAPPYKQEEAPSPQESKSDRMLGSGISEDEAEKIIREFAKR